MDFTYLPDLGRVRLRRVHRRRVRPEDRRLELRHLQGCRARDDAAADGDLAAPARRAARRAGRADRSRGRRDARQYTSIRFTEHLDLEGIRPSIGSVGDAYDNALMESVVGLFKTECIRTTVFHAGAYRGLPDVEWATAGWVDWYNNRRLHSSLDYLTPQEFEQAHYAAISREPQPA
jgi:transposase InsO family protein